MTAPVLVTHHLHIRNGSQVLCRHLDLHLVPGQCWGLLGRNGAGKTTLLHTLAGLRPPSKGQILVDGQELASWKRRDLARRLGLLLQQRQINFPITVESLVMSGRYPHIGPWRTPGVTDQLIVNAALAQVSMSGFNQRLVPTLSGGEQQRAYLAALLAQQPQILLLDEPVAHLDLTEQYRLLSLLRGLADKGHVVIMSLHDINHALWVCDHLLLLHRGRALRGPTMRLNNPKLLTRIFGIQLTRLQGPTGRMLVPHVVLSHPAHARYTS